MNLYSSVNRVLDLLSWKDKWKILMLGILQFLVSILDSIGILLMGSVAGVGLSIVSPENNTEFVDQFEKFLSIENSNPSLVLIILSGLVILALLLRTIFSLFISIRTYSFLAVCASNLSETFLLSLIRSPFSWIRKQSVNDLAFALTQGIQNSVIGVLGQFIMFASELFFLIMMFVILFIVNPGMTLVSGALFLVFGLIVYLRIGKKISNLSNLASQRVVDGNQQIINTLSLFREIVVLSRHKKIAEDFRESRLDSGELFAKLNWYQIIPKFSVEVAVVLGAFVLAVVSAVTSDFAQAISDLVIFLAATSRLAPSALRLQQSLIGVKAFAGQSEISFNYFKYLKEEPRTRIITGEKILDYHADQSDIPTLTFENVRFNFDDSKDLVLNELTFKVDPCEVVALVGPSGSGKSTLCDLALGLLTPSMGTIRIDDIEVSKYVANFPGRISYLPQETLIIPGTILENIAIGLHLSHVDMEALQESLKNAQLIDFVESLPYGLNQRIGDTGIRLSGGQRQRLGIARALYSQPKILILDEPTSALDLETETNFLDALNSIRGRCSILVITHRLSTLKYVDKVMYLKKGRLFFIGTADEAKNRVPEFHSQVSMEER